MPTVYDYRSAIKDTLMRKLYQAQLKYWNNRISRLSNLNAMCYGRKIRSNSPLYSIYFQHKRWQPDHLDWTDNVESAYCLALHPDFPDMRVEMLEIADEFEKLRNERYEAERFLSGLVLFTAPPERMEQILGHTLYSPCREAIKRFYGDYTENQWDCNGEFSLRTFVEKNQGILKAMNARILYNLITLTGTEN